MSSRSFSFICQLLMKLQLIKLLEISIDMEQLFVGQLSAHQPIFSYSLMGKLSTSIDDYAKDGGPGVV